VVVKGIATGICQIIEGGAQMRQAGSYAPGGILDVAALALGIQCPYPPDRCLSTLDTSSEPYTPILPRQVPSQPAHTFNTCLHSVLIAPE
jgi:hypothetical protein